MTYGGGLVQSIKEGSWGKSIVAPGQRQGIANGIGTLKGRVKGELNSINNSRQKRGGGVPDLGSAVNERVEGTCIR